MIYDRGFALQSKAVLVESTTTVEQVVQHVTDAFNLIGGPDDYALEERDILAGSQCSCVYVSYWTLQCCILPFSKPTVSLNRNPIAKKTELWLTRVLYRVSAD